MSCGEGKNNLPLEDGRFVLRLARGAMDGGVALAGAFELSSADEAEDLPSLSVWEDTCCSAARAIELYPPTKPFTIVGRLKVHDVRSVTAAVPHLTTARIDVVWRNLYLGSAMALDTRDGAFGHCGIIGLKKPPGMQKIIFKSLREELSRIGQWSRLT